MYNTGQEYVEHYDIFVQENNDEYVKLQKERILSEKIQIFRS